MSNMEGVSWEPRQISGNCFLDKAIKKFTKGRSKNVRLGNTVQSKNWIF